MNHYLVAMDFSTKKLTINGERYFDHLPQLVQVSWEKGGRGLRRGGGGGRGEEGGGAEGEEGEGGGGRGEEGEGEGLREEGGAERGGGAEGGRKG